MYLLIVPSSRSYSLMVKLDLCQPMKIHKLLSNGALTSSFLDTHPPLCFLWWSPAHCSQQTKKHLVPESYGAKQMRLLCVRLLFPWFSLKKICQIQSYSQIPSGSSPLRSLPWYPRVVFGDFIIINNTTCVVLNDWFIKALATLLQTMCLSCLSAFLEDQYPRL